VIVYLDASALVKRYVEEAGSDEVASLIDAAAVVGTSIVSRAEVAAALAKASRMQVVARPRRRCTRSAVSGWRSRAYR